MGNFFYRGPDHRPYYRLVVGDKNSDPSISRFHFGTDCVGHAQNYVGSQGRCIQRTGYFHNLTPDSNTFLLSIEAGAISIVSKLVVEVHSLGVLEVDRADQRS